MRFYDAHNHLQDARFEGRQEELINAARAAGVVRMVVNGSCEGDWPTVRELALKHPEVIPSFGYHPWHVGERTARWREVLIEHLNSGPGAIGEIGLDCWKPGLPYEPQEPVFLEQLGIAAERNLPISIHCLQAWGRLFELLQSHPRPSRGFLLHSFGGPVELVRPLVQLGAYFSFPGYFLHPRKERHRATFRQIPRERLLVETDAPDQLPPAECNSHPGLDSKGNPINHPANLPAIVLGLAIELGDSLESLALQVEANFHRLFE
ncbi:MAG: TatD family deoxyribonuclease [Pedosphaera sp.]|nr:TatD family deoxyribonuclease [Pedosphaera sp.]